MEQRELKFRIYAVTDYGYKMVYLDILDCDNGLWFSSQEHIDEYKDKIMQFTGLNDKNGKEIWEGDIVECHDHPTGVEDTIGIVEFKHGYYNVNGYALHDYGTAWTEVRGNRFTNPELIPHAPQE